MPSSPRFVHFPRRLVAALIAVMASAALAGAATPQTVQSIAAVVNEDVITTYDLQSRMRLVLAISNIPDDQEARRRLLPQVLRQLIDERLQMQEAKRLNISATDREIAEAVATLERQNNLPAGGLDDYLRQQGVPFETMLDQIRSNIAWTKVVRRQIRPRVEVGEEEIDAFLQDLRARGGRTVYDVSEIFIAADSPNERPEAVQTAHRIVEQARAGTPFAALARQFSQSSTAAAGGELGTVQEGQLDPRLEAALAGLQPGEVSEPIPVENGAYVLRLVGKRRVGEAAVAGAPTSDVTVSMRRIFLPVAADAPQEEVQRQAQLAERVVETVSGCDEMERVAAEVGSAGAVDIGRLRLADLPDPIRPTVASMPVGAPSQPIRTQEGFLVLMVCERSGGGAAMPAAVMDGSLPSREEVMQLLGTQRIDMMARRHLRDLRRAAFVDIRR